MSLTRATIKDVSTPARAGVPVMFNPTELAVQYGAHYAEFPIPGRRTPLLQYVRGTSDQLTLELFLDGTDAGKDRGDVREHLAELRRYVEIDGKLHAPPVCRFEWETFVFQGVVTSLSERHLLFGHDGALLRARVDVSIKRYDPSHRQATRQPQSSPDRTQLRVLREGETLARIAHEEYGDSSLWQVIAEANDIDRPRFVAPGTPLVVPSIE